MEIKMSIHTDMAVEAHEYFSGRKGTLPQGIKVEKRVFGGLKYTGISVTDEEGAKYIEKPIGTYITFEAEDLRGFESESNVQNRSFIAREIEKLLKKNNISDEDTILVVGLGNRSITPDALGPKVVSSLFVSRHLFEHLPEIKNADIRPVCAVSPGVLGTTGIETLEIIRGITEHVKPKCIIAVDALVARNISRLGKSVQLSDSGINPGSGVGNHRKGINAKTLGVPVISVGIPMVVDAATIADDIFESSVTMFKSASGKESKFYEMLSEMNPSQRKAIFTEALSDLSGELIVTPKDIDEMVSDLAKVISSALNMGLHKGDVSPLLQ